MKPKTVRRRQSRQERASTLNFVENLVFDLKIKSLEDIRGGIRLLNVRTVGEDTQAVQLATVYIPKSKSGHFLKKILDYKDANTSHPTDPKPKNEPLVTSIGDIRAAFLPEFWTDDPSKMPSQASCWVEVWLSTTVDAEIAQFREAIAQLGIPERGNQPLLKFPERSVLLLFANRDQLLKALVHSDNIAELRAAREPCTFFVDMENAEQSQWVNEMLDRVDFDASSNVSICILDRGVNPGHPLLKPALSDEDLHTVDPQWGTHDHDLHGHGTGMAGISLYGDLQAKIESNQSITVRHKLESAKILPPPNFGETKENLWGAVTAQGIYRAEIQSPFRLRIICMAISAERTRDRGNPTSWSAELDQLAAGVDDDKFRLIVASAGNIKDNFEWAKYPTSILTNEVQDPAQSWNALTVGAYTNKTRINHPQLKGYTPIALAGELSPLSSTSNTWPKKQVAHQT